MWDTIVKGWSWVKDNYVEDEADVKDGAQYDYDDWNAWKSCMPVFRLSILGH